MSGERLWVGLDTLAFPKHLAREIGYCAWSIGMMKKAGCRFCGRKTTIRWVREFLGAHPEFKTSAALAMRHKADLGRTHNRKDRQVSVSGKSDEPRDSRGR